MLSQWSICALKFNVTFCQQTALLQYRKSNDLDSYIWDHFRTYVERSLQIHCQELEDEDEDNDDNNDNDNDESKLSMLKRILDVHEFIDRRPGLPKADRTRLKRIFNKIKSKSTEIWTEFNDPNYQEALEELAYRKYQYENLNIITIIIIY